MSYLLSPYKLKMNILVVLALFVNAIAPISVAFAQQVSAEEAELEALFGDKIIICTPFGYKYIDLEDFKNGEHPTEDGSSFHCSLCGININGDILYTPSSIEIYYKEISASAYYHQGIEYYFDNIEATGQINPRAPPASFYI